MFLYRRRTECGAEGEKGAECGKGAAYCCGMRRRCNKGIVKVRARPCGGGCAGLMRGTDARGSPARRVRDKSVGAGRGSAAMRAAGAHKRGARQKRLAEVCSAADLGICTKRSAENDAVPPFRALLKGGRAALPLASLSRGGPPRSVPAPFAADFSHPSAHPRGGLPFRQDLSRRGSSPLAAILLQSTPSAAELP